MKSKTFIEKQAHKKTNPKLVKAIIAAKKNLGWLKIAGLLSSPRRKKIQVNLDNIDKNSELGDIIVIPGKVLSLGEISKKIRVVALNFSEKAKEKLLKAGCETSNIADEIKKNPNAKGIKILKC